MNGYCPVASWLVSRRVLWNATSICLMATIATNLSAQSADATPGSGVEITLDMVEPIHTAAAKEYLIYSDEERSKPLQLRKTPISQWINQRRSGGQLGHVFVWMDGERPAAMAAFFSFPWRGVATDRRVVHELHALAPGKLEVTRNGGDARWQPQAGLSRQPIPGVNAAADSLARFKIRSRQVARRFTGYCVDPEKQRWELRLLPTPLLVYPINQSDGVRGYGAVIGMMGDAGSDLESGLVIEATTSSDGSDRNPQWSFAPIRMTDMETHLLFDNKPIWESVRTAKDTRFYDADHVYFRFQDQTVPLDSLE